MSYSTGDVDRMRSNIEASLRERVKGMSRALAVDVLRAAGYTRRAALRVAPAEGGTEQ